MARTSRFELRELGSGDGLLMTVAYKRLTASKGKISGLKKPGLGGSEQTPHVPYHVNKGKARRAWVALIRQRTRARMKALELTPSVDYHLRVVFDSLVEGIHTWNGQTIGYSGGTLIGQPREWKTLLLARLSSQPGPIAVRRKIKRQERADRRNKNLRIRTLNGTSMRVWIEANRSRLMKKGWDQKKIEKVGYMVAYKEARATWAFGDKLREQNLAVERKRSQRPKGESQFQANQRRIVPAALQAVANRYLTEAEKEKEGVPRVRESRREIARRLYPLTPEKDLFSSGRQRKIEEEWRRIWRADVHTEVVRQNAEAGSSVTSPVNIARYAHGGQPKEGKKKAAEDARVEVQTMEVWHFGWKGAQKLWKKRGEKTVIEMIKKKQGETVQEFRRRAGLEKK